MNSGIYGACAALMARMEALDSIASNVSNSSTAGFRGQQDLFGSVLAEAGTQSRMSLLNKATNQFSQLAGTQLDTTQGTITSTGNQLDMAVRGDGYFKIQRPSGFAYTRDGQFMVNAQGQLTTQTGDLVIGEAGPVTVGKGQVTVSSDGMVASDGAICGKLTLVNFPPGTALLNQGASVYAAPSGSEIPATGASVQQGALEGSNVSPMEGVVELISAQRAAESMRHALSLIDGEMDKTAVQDLARTN